MTNYRNGLHQTTTDRNEADWGTTDWQERRKSELPGTSMETEWSIPLWNGEMEKKEMELAAKDYTKSWS